MTSEVAFRAVYEDVDGGWVQARLVEIPGVITTAPTRDEAAELLVDALAEYVRSFADPDAPADPAGSPVSVVISAA